MNELQLLSDVKIRGFASFTGQHFFCPQWVIHVEAEAF